MNILDNPKYSHLLKRQPFYHRIGKTLLYNWARFIFSWYTPIKIFGKENILEKMPPYMGGGEMIKDVSFKETTFNSLPYKFEAGTPNIGDVIGFKESINNINKIGVQTNFQIPFSHLSNILDNSYADSLFCIHHMDNYHHNHGRSILSRTHKHKIFRTDVL